MKKWMRTLSRLSLAVMPGFVLLSVAGGAAAGQKPVLVKNTDEPGRTPYEVEVEFYNGGCASSICANFVVFGQVTLLDVNSPVPAGKRLVVRHVSGQLFAGGGCGYCSVGLQSTRVLTAQALKWSFLGPFYSSSPSAGLIANGFSSDMFVTVGPGELPHLRVQVPTLTNTISYVAISGYLIDAE